MRIFADKKNLGTSPPLDHLRTFFHFRPFSLTIFEFLPPTYLKYAHPIIVIHLHKLFNELLRHGYVPKEFGHRIIIPLVKDCHGNTSNIDSYRAITVSSKFLSYVCMINSKDF